MLLEGTFLLGQRLFWSQQQFAGRDVSHTWFGCLFGALDNTPEYLAGESLLRSSHGALSATESSLRLRAQRYNRECTPDACAAMSRGGFNISINQLLRAAWAGFHIIERFTANTLST